MIYYIRRRLCEDRLCLSRADVRDTCLGRMARTLVALALVLFAGCQSSLPDPDSMEARLYRARCSEPCHVAYAPGSLTTAMWAMKVDSMAGEMARRGSPLSAEEKRTVLRYLQEHSADAAVRAPSSGGPRS